MIVKRKSIISNQWNELDLDITEEQMFNYENRGMLLQNAFPDLPIPEREFIKTGITPEEWKAEFGSLDQIEEPDEHDYLL